MTTLDRSGPQFTPTQLLDRYKAALRLKSDYAVHKLLHVTRTTISRWRHGHSMDEASAVQIAEALKIPPMAVIAELRLQMDCSPHERAVWERYRARVFVAALVAVTAAATALTVQFDLTESGNYVSATSYTLCALTITALMRWVRR